MKKVESVNKDKKLNCSSCKLKKQQAVKTNKIITRITSKTSKSFEPSRKSQLEERSKY